MKLLSKTSVYYLLFALPAFAICSFVLFNWVSAEIQDTLDESLWKEKIKTEQRLKAGKSVDDDSIALQPTLIDALDGERAYVMSDTMMYDSLEEELLPYRVLRSVVNDGKSNYLFTIRKSTIESEDLIESIFYPIIFLLVLLLSGFFFINWYVSKKIWSPFYKTLKQLEQYKITEKAEKFNSTSIVEFSELNAALTAMTEKMQSDYNNQKQFIENASHEIQTPLAVIKTKIELLIQSAHLNESDMSLIQSAYNAANKLSSLNKALLLLSKIENDQFKDLEILVDFRTLTAKTVSHFEDQAAAMNIQIETKGSASPQHKMNSMLADILISNLVQNAIRHNVKEGSIQIVFEENKMVLSNTSDTTVTNTSELFNRFRKNEASAESIGLGLAIVKEICSKYGVNVSYSVTDKMHSLELRF